MEYYTAEQEGTLPGFPSWGARDELQTTGGMISDALRFKDQWRDSTAPGRRYTTEVGGETWSWDIRQVRRRPLPTTGVKTTSLYQVDARLQGRRERSRTWQFLQGEDSSGTYLNLGDDVEEPNSSDLPRVPRSLVDFTRQYAREHSAGLSTEVLEPLQRSAPLVPPLSQGVPESKPLHKVRKLGHTLRAALSDSQSPGSSAAVQCKDDWSVFKGQRRDRMEKAGDDQWALAMSAIRARNTKHPDTQEYLFEIQGRRYKGGVSTDNGHDPLPDAIWQVIGTQKKSETSADFHHKIVLQDAMCAKSNGVSVEADIVVQWADSLACTQPQINWDDIRNAVARTEGDSDLPPYSPRS